MTDCEIFIDKKHSMLSLNFKEKHGNCNEESGLVHRHNESTRI